MLNINRDIHSLSNFKRNTPEFLRQLKESGHPVVLTVNGKAELVVQDAGSYQRLIDLAEKAERMETLRASVEEMRAGKGIPADEVLAEMRQILDEAKKKPVQ
jgi:PHD/YefM family antitoxin component YafN of YafNO toxin-antitoxin module